MVRLRLLCILLLSLFLSGCDGLSFTSSEEQLIRIGTNVWPGYEPLYLARDLDRWPHQNIRLIEFPSASEVLRAFRNHSIEAASLTLDEVLLLRQQNIPVTIVLIHDISAGGDGIVAKSNIANVPQLKGRRVALEAGALGALVITRALEQHNMQLSDIEVINTDASMHERVFINDEADAVVTFDPIRTRLLQLGGREIFNSKEIPGEIVDVLAVHNDILTNNPNRIKQLLKSWFKALSYMEHNMDEAAAIMAKRLKISPKEVIASYQGLELPDLKKNRKILGSHEPLLQNTIEMLNRVLVDNQLLSHEVKERIFTDHFLPNDGK